MMVYGLVLKLTTMTMTMSKSAGVTAAGVTASDGAASAGVDSPSCTGGGGMKALVHWTEGCNEVGHENRRRIHHRIRIFYHIHTH